MKKLPLIIALASGTLLIPVTDTSAQLYSDNFDLNSLANYTVNQDPDTEVLFSYDYSANGIPSAPNSVGGTTLGVRFRANIDTTAGAAAINISPTGQGFVGDYTLRYDLWMNANGPFPAGGGGSTQFATAGVGNSGTAIQRSSGTANGPWFAVDSEGGSGIDYRAYRGIALEGPTSTAYAASDDGIINRRNADNSYYHTTFPGGQSAPASQGQTGSLAPGTIGFAWRDVQISVTGGTNITWTIDGLLIATLNNATLGGSNIFVGHWDVFSSITADPSLNFSIVDNLRVVAVPEPSTIALGVLGALGVLFVRRKK